MAILSTLTLDGDGTIGANVVHDAGTGSPFYTHGNDTPNGASSDWIANDTAETSTSAWFSLSNVNADFSSMDTLNIDVDVQSTGFSNDTCTLTARIFAADNDTGTPLTAETGNLATQADSTRTQRNVVFGSLTGTKTQWNGAYIRFSWTYAKVTGPDNAQLKLFGCDIDGTYTIGAQAFTLTAEAGSFTLSGQVATFGLTRKLTANAGSFTLSGQNALLKRSYADLVAQAGSFTLSGQDATFGLTRRLVAETGAFTLTGQNATLTYVGEEEEITRILCTRTLMYPNRLLSSGRLTVERTLL